MPYYEVVNLVTLTKTYDRRHAFCLWNPKNTCVENTAWSRRKRCSRCLRLTGACVPPTPQFDYPISQISYSPECTSITAGDLRNNWECTYRVWEHFAKLQGGLGASGSTLKHSWGLPECLGGLHVASRVIYIVPMHYNDPHKLSAFPHCVTTSLQYPVAKLYCKSPLSRMGSIEDSDLLATSSLVI